MGALVSVIMGSRSDWAAMEHCVSTLEELGVPIDVRVLSAHRTPDALIDHIEKTEASGVEVYIAAAGGAAHLAGAVAARTTRPVLGVPMQSKTLDGLDSLLSTVQMPAGVPVATLAIGKAGAVNAALFASAILATKHPEIGTALAEYREAESQRILADPDPRQPAPTGS